MKVFHPRLPSSLSTMLRTSLPTSSHVQMAVLFSRFLCLLLAIVAAELHLYQQPPAIYSRSLVYAA